MKSAPQDNRRVYRQLSAADALVEGAAVSDAGESLCRMTCVMEGDEVIVFVGCQLLENFKSNFLDMETMNFPSKYSPSINSIDNIPRPSRRARTRERRLCLHYAILYLFGLSSSIHLLFRLGLFQSFDSCCLFSNFEFVKVVMMI